jgi:hypothetical protein
VSAGRTRTADPLKMRLLSALTRDPNLIHLAGPRPVNQGPIVMSWLIDEAVRAAGEHASMRRFRIRFMSEIRGGDEVQCEILESASTDHGVEMVVQARVGDRVTARADASFQP